MKIHIELSAADYALGVHGAALLGYTTLGDALISSNQWMVADPEVDNILLGRLRQVLLRLGVPVPPQVPLRDVMQAIAPVIRDELDRGKRERHAEGNN